MFLVGSILTVFALSGDNNDFAILWILLVPIIATNLLGITFNFIISTYFFMLFFYTPLVSHIEGKYTAEFISRFPILYISLFLSFQKEFYYRVVY